MVALRDVGYIVFACTLTVFGIDISACASSTSSRIDSHSNYYPEILIGSSYGMAFFATRSNVLQELDSRRIGLYLHQSGVIQLVNAGVATKVANLFSHPVAHKEVVEITLPTQSDGRYSNGLALAYFDGIQAPWEKLYVDPGFRPASCNINGLDVHGKLQSVQDWITYKEILKAHGLQRCGAFGDPNDGAKIIKAFSDPYWNFYKQVALTLGGLALDTPPRFALDQGANYIHHIAEVIRWGQINRLRISLVLAPYNDGDDYKVNVYRYLRKLHSLQAFPTEIVIGGYEDGNNNKYSVSVFGSEEKKNTLNFVALSLLRFVGECTGFINSCKR